MDLEPRDLARPPRSVRVASCDLSVDWDRFYGMGSGEIKLNKPMSAPTHIECGRLSSLDKSQLQHSSSILLTTATTYAESGQRDEMKKRIPDFPKYANLSVPRQSKARP